MPVGCCLYLGEGVYTCKVLYILGAGVYACKVLSISRRGCVYL